MSPIKKYEAIGIFTGIAVMAVVLVFMRYDIGANALVKDIGTNSQGAVVVSTAEGESDDAAITDALIEASSGGELQKLVIDDILIGEGEAVTLGDIVSVHYIGRTQDGVEFDSSYTRGQPFVFKVGDGKVIEGWDVGLLDMQVGGQRILVIPSHMAYGDLQVGPIASGSTLVFAIELLSINQ